MWIPGLVLLIVGIVLSFIPFACIVGIPLAIVGLILLIVGLATSEAPATSVTPVKTCFACGQLVPVQYMICPYCGRPTAPAGPTASPQVVQKEPMAVHPSQKFCPTCGKWYPQDYKLCPQDGSELKAVQ